MGKTITLGGDRLGSEKKMKEYLHGYERSSHNIGCIITTDQAVGTLVPYFCDVATNGTTYYIDMATKVRTLPTNGPLFGTFKHQLDWFSIPIRLYIGALHNNALGIGLKMKEIKLPKISVSLSPSGGNIDQSSLLAYIGIRNTGKSTVETGTRYRNFPGIFALGYWDAYKNYYANKQEEVGYQVSAIAKTNIVSVTAFKYQSTEIINSAELPKLQWQKNTTGVELTQANFQVKFAYKTTEEDARKTKVYYTRRGNEMSFDFNEAHGGAYWVAYHTGDEGDGMDNWFFVQSTDQGNLIPGGELTTGNKATDSSQVQEMTLQSFPLENIDKMREEILATPKSTEFVFPTISNGNYAPYNFHGQTIDNKKGYEFSQAGLGIKTYLSDRFNNWLSTEWIDGATNGINEITSVDVSDGKLSMDELILSKKLFNMLNRIAISGGSYNDWQEAVYGVNTIRLAESPMYQGGMSSEVVFDEVVANSGYTDQNGEQALGSLAGRGTDKASKGGKSIKIRIEEPSMIMCIGSITPRVFYSQGNKWWNFLETMDDLHKPELDKIGFQELLTEEFAAFDSIGTPDNTGKLTMQYKSIGKQPSWIQYMTNVNQSFGSFAANEELEWMVLNRKYEADPNGNLKDGTTYIDPTMYNIPFADTKITAKNFWVQVAFDITARRKMSAKQIPNL